MTIRFATAALSALVVTTTFGASNVPAQDEAAQIREPVSEEVRVPASEKENVPNWPEGLDNWDNPARDPEGNPNEAEERGLTSPEVQENSAEGPTEQGTRTTETVGEEEEQGLYQLLAVVRASPPDVDGNSIPRPNPLASEPSKEMAPMQPEEVYLFADGYVE